MDEQRDLNYSCGESKKKVFYPKHFNVSDLQPLCQKPKLWKQRCSLFDRNVKKDQARWRMAGVTERSYLVCVMASAHLGIHTVQFKCVQEKKKKVGTNYFHVRSQAAQHPPQSARWPKPCANPRSCALMCPRKHTHTYTFAQQTLMSLTPNIYFLRRRTYTGTRLYFVHRDIRINRLVKLGLSSHIHRKHGIRCINAVCS